MQKYTHKLILFLFIYGLIFLPNVHAEQKMGPLWTPKDIRTLPSVSMSDVSADGKYTLMEVEFFSFLKDDEIHSHQCFLINNETLEKKTFGGESGACSQPYFIGDGTNFTYTLYDKETKKLNIYVENIRTHERKHVLEVPKGFQGCFFAPDGKSYAFMTQEIIPNPAKGIEGEDYDLDTKQTLSLQKLDAHFQPIGKPQPLLAPEMNMSPVGSSFPYVWSPDSQKIAIVIQKMGWKNASLYTLFIFDVNKEALEKIDEKPNRFDNLIFSPDSQKLAFIQGSNYGQQKVPLMPFKDIKPPTIEIVDLKTKKRESLPGVDIWSITGWTPDGTKLIGAKQVGTKYRIFEYDIASQKLVFKKIPDLSMTHSLRLSNNQKYMGFLGQNFHHPDEGYFTSVEDFKPKKITSINENIDLSQIQAKSIKWKSFDGVEIEGILVYPQNYSAGQKVPLIVSLHGGPSAVESEMFLGSSWFTYCPAVFSSLGYASLVINYRGSIGYGKKFSDLVYQDLGAGPFQDMMTGIDSVIKEGIVDPDQLFLTGHSFGGFLTAWAIGHTDRFKAALMRSGIVDWISHVSLTDAPQPMEVLFGDFYWDNYAAYRKASPLTYINDIKTPTLIVHGIDDERVDCTQAQQLYQALQAKNISTKLLLYKDEGHGFSSSAASIDSTHERIKWFDRYRK